LRKYGNFLPEVDLSAVLQPVVHTQGSSVFKTRLPKLKKIRRKLFFFKLRASQKVLEAYQQWHFPSRRCEAIWPKMSISSPPKPPLQCSGFRGFGTSSTSAKPECPMTVSPREAVEHTSVNLPQLCTNDLCDLDMDMEDFDFDFEQCLPTSSQINAEFDAMDQHMQTTLELLAKMPPTPQDQHPVDTDMRAALKFFAATPRGHHRHTSSTGSLMSLLSMQDGLAQEEYQI
jgi:hypothetical protein